MLPENKYFIDSLDAFHSEISNFTITILNRVSRGNTSFDKLKQLTFNFLVKITFIQNKTRTVKSVNLYHLAVFKTSPSVHIWLFKKKKKKEDIYILVCRSKNFM